MQGKPQSVVLERRERVYPRREKANPLITRIRFRWESLPYPELGYHDLSKRSWRPDDPGGLGWEIVRQGRACGPCALRHGSSVPPSLRKPADRQQIEELPRELCA